MAATVVLSVATTLITLSLEHMRRARRTAATPVPQAGPPTPSATAEPPAGQGDILSSRHHLAGSRHVPGRQPVKIDGAAAAVGVILNGCRTASPSATWFKDPRTRQFPGAAPQAGIQTW